MAATAELLRDVGRLLEQGATLERYLGHKGRAIVARVRLEDGTSVIVKGPARPVAEDLTDPWSPRNRFSNELAALGVLEGARGLVPRLVAADQEHSWMVIEDLGETVSLADRLLAADPVAATEALRGWATSLGQLHKNGRDRELLERWSSRRAELGGTVAHESAVAQLTAARDLLDTLVLVGDDVTAAALVVDRRLSDPRWSAMTPRDACPDNCALRPDGSVALFDFEGGGARHGLLDAAYLVTTFPTCWCTGLLPVEARAEGLAAYRAAAAWPLDAFDANLAAAGAFHALWVLGSPRFGTALSDDGAAGLRLDEPSFDVPSPRQNVSLVLDDLERAVEGDAELAALGDLAATLRRELSARWGGWELPAPHPAFR